MNWLKENVSKNSESIGSDILDYSKSFVESNYTYVNKDSIYYVSK
jgi:hypothetical protein